MKLAPPSWPGLTRPSMMHQGARRRFMDPRVKPAGDTWEAESILPENALAARQRAHRCEEIAHLALWNVAGDEDEAA